MVRLTQCGAFPNLVHSTKCSTSQHLVLFQCSLWSDETSGIGRQLWRSKGLGKRKIGTQRSTTIVPAGILIRMMCMQKKQCPIYSMHVLCISNGVQFSMQRDTTKSFIVQEKIPKQTLDAKADTSSCTFCTAMISV